ncbi:MAG: PEP-CTERM sorting domain-containing protein [Armatimonadota bacterium]
MHGGVDSERGGVLSRVMSLTAITIGVAVGLASIPGCTGSGGSEPSNGTTGRVHRIGGRTGYELPLRPDGDWDVTYTGTPEAMSKAPTSAPIGGDLTEVLAPDPDAPAGEWYAIAPPVSDHTVGVSPPSTARDDSGSGEQTANPTATPEPATWILLAATAGAAALIRRRKT